MDYFIFSVEPSDFCFVLFCFALFLVFVFVFVLFCFLFLVSFFFLWGVSFPGENPCSRRVAEVLREGRGIH